MTNTYVVCLIALCCASLSLAVPKECHQGPSVWCSSIKQGSQCGAVGHCIATLWDKRNDTVALNGMSMKVVRFFRQMKDIRELINEDYLATRLTSLCEDIAHVDIARICTDNTHGLHKYINHVLQSETTPETMCTLINMCNNDKIEDILMGKVHKLEAPDRKEILVGGQRCTWGPSYWCSNFSTGRECKATHHCVERVWSKMEFPVDDDNICKICTDMVQQARDQLQSNETQEELKEVFEGSCKLIPIKLVAKECIKLADDFVPELVETLASQMNPMAVCSVAGMCNNAKIDRLLEDYNTQLKLRVECNNCQNIVGGLRMKFETTSDEDFLVGMLKVCRQLGSFSDSCSMLVFKYYENISAALQKDLEPTSLCHVSGQCAYRYHSHDDYTFPMDVIGYKDTNDVPCELCEQLVTHLRDVMIANTTELEFYKVLKGLCKQTGKFKDECLHLAEQYYALIYKYLVDDLKPNVICSLMGVCGNNTEVPVAPLVDRELAVKVLANKPKLIGIYEANSYKTDKLARVPIANKETNVKVISDANPGPLPIERMFVSVPQVNGKAACSFCQYFLHYLQVEISDTRVEDQIIASVNHACERLPKSVEAECEQFVSQYGPAVIALLVQDIDPASVCPALGICPQIEEVRLVEENTKQSNCPLCLFAVEQLETTLKNNRSEERIREALDNLCTHLSVKLRSQCINFVDTYTQQLIEMLVADMDAQEICVFLKLCSTEVKHPFAVTQDPIDKYHDKPSLRGDWNNFRKKSLLPTSMLVQEKQDIETNEIFDNTANGREVRPPLPSASTLCVVCEFVLKEIDNQLKDKHNEDEIKRVVHGVCKFMPKSIHTQCDQFIDQYADIVINLLIQELSPKQVCTEIKLCPQNSDRKFEEVKESILDCAVCETVVMAVRKVLSNEKVDRNIVHIIEKSCNLLPAKYDARCHTMLEIYGDSIIHLIEEFGTKGVSGLRNATVASKP
ncbi:unnamed protein product [Arctia plantaginis]|uniref:Saposin n=1 Tax=Arctia plantaginis TaxID=874455 RepID=A0A8S0YU57_ARCPL|nr:unnamed protein product [Arctia plantaginis]CAB3248025.1 unnamed protein product [Arctia plantaginis]